MSKFSVEVNGKTIELHEARVSAVPFNRVWPGYQRSISQTEIAYFVSFDMDESSDIKVKLLDGDVDTVEIRPFEFELPYTVRNNEINIHITEPKCFTVEVNGCHCALHVFANPKKNYEKTDNMIYFGKGIHDAGLIFPKSNQIIFIDEGATVHGAICAYKVDNVKIIGHGVLDGSHFVRPEAAVPNRADSQIAEGLKLAGLSQQDINYSGVFTAIECKNLSVDGITLRDSMFWTMIIKNCENVLIDNIKIIGQWRYNSDGINVWCSNNVTVSNSFVRSFDDCIVVRGAYLSCASENCSNIKVDNCVLWCDWGKSLEIWQGNAPSVIEDVTFNNIYIVRCCQVAMDITTWYGAVGVVTKNIVFKNIFVNSDKKNLIPEMQLNDSHAYGSSENKEFKPLLILINTSHLGTAKGNQAVERTSDFSKFNMEYSDIIFNNIHCDISDYAVLIEATNCGISIENIMLRNVTTDLVTVKGNVRNFTLK